MNEPNETKHRLLIYALPYLLVNISRWWSIREGEANEQT